MLGQGIVLLAGPDQQVGVVLLQPAEHGLAHRLEQRVAGDGGDARVEQHVRIDEGIGVAKACALARQGFLQADDRLCVGLLGRLAHHAQLEEAARLLQMLQRGRGTRQEHAGGIVDLLEDRPGGRLANACPLAVRNGEQAEYAQLLHGFADGRTADTEAVHQFAFRGEGVPGLQLSAGDQRLEAVENLIGELATDNALIGEGHEAFRLRPWVRRSLPSVFRRDKSAPATVPPLSGNRQGEFPLLQLKS